MYRTHILKNCTLNIQEVRLYLVLLHIPHIQPGNKRLKKINQDVGSFNYARNKTVQQLEQCSELAVLKRVLS